MGPSVSRVPLLRKSVALAIAVIALVTQAGAARAANESLYGQWSVPFSMAPTPGTQSDMWTNRFNDVPVNATVFPSGTQDAKLVYWGSSYAFFQLPYSSTTSWLNPGSLTPVRISKPINGSGASSPDEFFCSGQTIMSDGRMMIAGGHIGIVSEPSTSYTGFDRWVHTYDTGPRLAYRFDQVPANDTRWTKFNDMGVPRYYPTATTLHDGRVLVTSGNVGQYYVMLGGETSAGGNPITGLHVIEDSDTYRQFSPTFRTDYGPALTPEIKGHASLYDGLTYGQDYNRFRVITVGGIGMSGGSQVFKNDVFAIFRHDNHDNQSYADKWEWTTLTPNPGTGVNSPPAGRAYHTAVKDVARRKTDGTWHMDPADLTKYVVDNVMVDCGTEFSCGTPPCKCRYTGSVVVFGGLTGSVASPTPTDELWTFSYRARDEGGFAPPNLTQSGYWNNTTNPSRVVGTNWPSARFGHGSAVIPRRNVVGASSSSIPGALIVYGGRTLSGGVESTIAENGDIWVCNLEDAGPTWTRISPLNAASVGSREGVSMIYKPSISGDVAGVYLFGGRRKEANGTYTYFNDFWKLTYSVASDGHTLSAWTWTPITVSGPLPLARHQAALALDDVQHAQFILSGGEGPQSPGSQTIVKFGDVYRQLVSTAVAFEWREIIAGSIGNPTARSGHTLVVDPRITNARTHELFDPATGNWSPLTASGQTQLWMEQYPAIFQLADKRIFYAGPSKQNRIFDWGSGWLNPTGSGAPRSVGVGSTSVMYRPDVILKCGDGTNTTTGQIVERIDFTLGASPTWQRLTDLPERRFHHNMTILPNGNVLLTGGDAGGTTMETMGITSESRHRTLMWNSNSFSEVAADPVARKYHSTAVLLPDARVLTAGGFGKTDTLAHTGAIYTPPYLFKANNTMYTDAERPQIVSVSVGALGYDPRPFTITLNATTPISNVCLIRASAVTHNFNMDQRYVPLRFVQTGTLVTVSKLSAFANSSNQTIQYVAEDDGANNSGRAVLTPGWYMLFVVRNDGVPSIARWIQVDPSLPSGHPTPDDAKPGVSPISVSASWQPGCVRRTSIAWTNAGDDDYTGTATNVEVRKSVNPITDANFAGATLVASVVPLDPKNLQGVSFDSPSSPTGTWYFAVRTKDENNNLSAVSSRAFTYTGMCFQGRASENLHAPEALVLKAPSPTPSRGEAVLTFGIPQRLVNESIELNIFDAAGRRVRQLVGNTSGDGWNSVRWDLQDENGGAARAGIYFARLKVGQEQRTARVVVVN